MINISALCMRLFQLILWFRASGPGYEVVFVTEYPNTTVDETYRPCEVSSHLCVRFSLSIERGELLVLGFCPTRRFRWSFSISQVSNPHLDSLSRGLSEYGCDGMIGSPFFPKF